MNTDVMVARKELQLTQDQIAEATGMTVGDVVRIERHGWIPPAKMRQRLAEVLHVTADKLFPSVVTTSTP